MSSPLHEVGWSRFFRFGHKAQGSVPKNSGESKGKPS